MDKRSAIRHWHLDHNPVMNNLLRLLPMANGAKLLFHSILNMIDG